MDRLRPLLALALGSLSLPAEAEAPACTATIYVWELQLTQVAADAGQPDLKAVAKALGSAAELRGGFRDPARPNEPVRVEMLGSSDGAGLNLGLQAQP